MWSTYVFVCMVVSCQRTATAYVVHTTDGPINGSTLTLPTNKQVEAFLGIPYAAPPLGKHRFFPPQPVTPWTNLLQTQSFSKCCVQGATDEMRKDLWWVHSLPESEDCLYLNVWRPTRKNTDEKLPIMILTHGGGFYAGSASMPLYDGGILASENNVIVASMNYRLFSYGFLYLNSTDVHGNAGLQDQILAIKWVKDNAKAFGGDPNLITIFGESAGSISVGIHLINPALSDLFQYGILESFSAFSQVATISAAQALSISLSLARNLSCPTEDKHDMLICLQGKDQSDLLSYRGDLISSSILIPYPPVRNGIEIPFDIEKATRNIPPSRRRNIISGTVPGELDTLVFAIIPGKRLTDDEVITETDLRNFLKSALQLDDERLQDVPLHEYRDYDSGYNSSQVRLEAANLLTDALVTCPQFEFENQWLNGSDNVYRYYFTHRPSRSFEGTAPVPAWAGTIHGDELPFVFGQPLNPEYGYTQLEVELSRVIMNYWTNFAKTGNPNRPCGDATIWPALNVRNSPYLNLGDEITPGTFLKARQCGLWNDLFPELVSIQQKLT